MTGTTLHTYLTRAQFHQSIQDTFYPAYVVYAVSGIQMDIHKYRRSDRGGCADRQTDRQSDRQTDFSRMLHMKFGFDWPSGFREEAV